jgi:FMN phosphatase YigB (HAD superfamily)
LKAVFFDIGNTLGTVSKDADKFILNPFDTTQAFLRSFQDALGFKLGIITNILPEMTDDVARQLLAAAGFLTFFNDGAIVTNRDAGVRKPNVKTYQ